VPRGKIAVFASRSVAAVLPVDVVWRPCRVKRVYALVFAGVRVVELAYEIRIRPVVRSLVGMVRVNVPAVTVCEPKVNTATALPAVLLEL
jgi:hypothetical protein